MFIRNKRHVLTWSLSMWCVYLAGLLELAPYIVPYLDGYIPRWAAIACLVVSPLARIIDQGGLSDGR
ncbi:MAG: hypothetical protein AAAC47_08145 [Pararhizobium sp.]